MQMEKFTKVSGNQIKGMVMVYLKIVMEKFIMGIGNLIYTMDKVKN